MSALRKEEEVSLKDLMKNPEMLQTQCYVNGQWIDAKSGEISEVENPATGEIIATVPKMGYDEITEVIDQAHEAWGAWRSLLASQRAKLMLKWAEILVENRDDIGTIMSQEQGKPISQAKGEVDYAASFIEWYAFEGQSISGETVQQTKAGRRETVWKEPVGVSAAITPWNFPAAMIARKVAPALAAGCPAISKPAENTPLTALAMAKCAEMAGIPAGIFNVVTGKASEIGKSLTDNGKVRKLSFTGSTPIGKLLYKQCADTVKKMSLELGGNAPFIVFEDADLDAAISGLSTAKFRNTGQTCVCANRIFVHESIYDEFKAKVVALAESLNTCDPMDEASDVGCLVDNKAYDGVKGLVDRAVEAGATILTGGEPPKGMTKPFFAPTVMENITNDMEIAQEEIFGPVATLIKFSTEEEVIEMANDTPFGLASYFFTQDMKRTFRVAEALEYGMVGANLGHVSSVTAPFGGYKESGIGRESSSYGLEEFLEAKYLAIGELHQ
ncbi:MAG: NAD-dependent succinate-semialdehyde dehydrogenase [Rickettsiales bacterium]|nr:NAD-dependent succinate-semialdehyde dehydrogenase [Rickettsiales bacterium]